MIAEKDCGNARSVASQDDHVEEDRRDAPADAEDVAKDVHERGAIVVLDLIQETLERKSEHLKHSGFPLLDPATSFHCCDWVF